MEESCSSVTKRKRSFFRRLPLRFKRRGSLFKDMLSSFCIAWFKLDPQGRGRKGESREHALRKRRDLKKKKLEESGRERKREYL